MPILLGDLCAFHFPKSGGSSMQAAAVPRKNENPNGSHYRPLYDDDMVDWVEQADGQIIEALGWRPFQPAPNALLPGLR